MININKNSNTNKQNTLKNQIKNQKNQQHLHQQQIQCTIKVYDGIYIGNQISAQDLDMIILNHVTHIITLDPSQIYPHFTKMGIKYLQIQGWKQIPHQVIQSQDQNQSYKQNYNIKYVQEIPSLDIYSVIQFMLQAQQQGQSTLICSTQSFSRPFCLMTLYLMHKYGWSLFKSFDLMRFRIPNTNIRESYYQYLQQEQKQLLLQNKVISYNWDLSSNTNISSQQLIIRNTYINATMKKIKQQQGYVEIDQKKLKSKNLCSKKQYQSNFHSNRMTITTLKSQNSIAKKQKRVQWKDLIEKRNHNSKQKSQEKSRKRMPPTPPLRNNYLSNQKPKAVISSLKIEPEKNLDEKCLLSKTNSNNLGSNKRNNQKQKQEQDQVQVQSNRIQKRNQIIVNVKDVIQTSSRNNSKKSLKRSFFQNSQQLQKSTKNLKNNSLKCKKDQQNIFKNNQQLDLERIKALLNKKKDISIQTNKNSTISSNNESSNKNNQIMTYQNSITQDFSLNNNLLEQKRNYQSVQIFKNKINNYIQKSVNQIRQQEQTKISKIKTIKQNKQALKIKKSNPVDNLCQQIETQRIFTEVFIQNNEQNEKSKLQKDNSQTLYKISKNTKETLDSLRFTQNLNQKQNTSKNIKSQTARKIVQRILNSSLSKARNATDVSQKSSKFIGKQNKFFLGKRQQSDKKIKKSSELTDRSLKKLIFQSQSVINLKHKWK